MRNVLLIALRTTLVTLILTGIAYPLMVTGLAQVIFPHKANGSLVEDSRGQVVGSEWIGQSFKNAGYFQPRPSAAGQNGYDAAASGGSNLGPTSGKLKDRVKDDLKRLQSENAESIGPIPTELVTASASGLDPHLSPQAASWQVERIASARKIAPERIRAILDANREGRDWGVFGESRLNVLLLNLALDRQFGGPSKAQ